MTLFRLNNYLKVNNNRKHLLVMLQFCQTGSLTSFVSVVNIRASEITLFRANKNVLKQGDEAVLICEFSRPLPFGTKFHIAKLYGNQSQQFDEELFDRFEFNTEETDSIDRATLSIKSRCFIYFNNKMAM